MRFSFWPIAQQAWDPVLHIARHVERTGWDGVWFADHFMPNAADNSGPTLEVWSVLSALAASVPRVRIGSMVLGNTYRHPAVVANMASTLDQISGGRVVLGMGAGWQENEHTAYGLEYSTMGGRLRRLNEACQVINGLLRNERTTFKGKYYQLEDAPLAPKPVQARLPLMIGGGGEKVTLRIVAEHADEWNVWADVARFVQKKAILASHCEAVGRDPAEIKRSVAVLMYLTDDQARVRELRGTPQPRPTIAGNPEQMAEILNGYAEAGLDELIVPDFHMPAGAEKTDILDRFMTEVAAPFRD